MGGLEQSNVKFRRISVISRAPTGGGRISALPRRFFADSGKTAARSAAKFDMTIPSSFLHVMCKFLLPNLKGQVTRSV